MRGKFRSSHFFIGCIVITGLIVTIVSGLFADGAGASPPHKWQVQHKGHMHRGPLNQARDLSHPLPMPVNRPRLMTFPGRAISQHRNSPLVDNTGAAVSFVPANTNTCTSENLNMKELIIAADGNEADLPAIKQELDYLGTPYDIYLASQTPNGLTPDKLGSACQGYYQGVILTDSYLSYYNGSSWVSALSQTEWNTLWSYEATMGARELIMYTYPTADFGYQAPTGAFDTSTNPLSTQLTTAGQSVFSYLNPSATVAIQYAYTYTAKPLADGATTPLLSDASGNALAAVHSYTDGRQVLSLTFDSNPNLLHDMVLSYGLVNWLTGGLFLGERHIYLSPQIDDVFIDDNTWPASTPCGTNVEQTGTVYRATGSDLQTLVNWQQGYRAQNQTQNMRLTLAFNAFGTTPDAGYTPDSLTPAAKTNQGQFAWMNHTYDHTTLDTMNYNDSSAEITQNNQAAASMGFTTYSKLNMVTPGVSGLTNTQFLQAAYDSGIRYLVTDTSVAGYANPSPNAGIYNAYQPQILMIPRRPSNLFYNVSQPSEWVAEYNCIYQSYWGRNLTLQEILNQESQTLLTYLLKGDIDPWMFHQSNMRAYDGTHSLFGQLMDLTMQKYAQYYNLNILSPTMDSLGTIVANRMAYNGAGVTASIVPGVSVTITAQKTARIPVTGLNASGSETYGGQHISYVNLQAGQSVTLPLA